MEHVSVEQHEGVAVVTLTDIARRNAMTAPMVDEIVATFDTLESDGTTHAVVLTGAAPAFCSGADVSSLGALAQAERDEERRSVTSIYEGFLRVLRSPLPTIAAVNGPAVGAGMNLALACDVRVAGVSARFDTRFLKIGLHPGGGHTWMLERAVGPQAAAAMVLFGVTIDGPRAVEIGLAWTCHADDELIPPRSSSPPARTGRRSPCSGGPRQPCAKPPGSPISRPRSPRRSRIRPGHWARAGSNRQSDEGRLTDLATHGYDLAVTAHPVHSRTRTLRTRSNPPWTRFAVPLV